MVGFWAAELGEVSEAVRPDTRDPGLPGLQQDAPLLPAPTRPPGGKGVHRCILEHQYSRSERSDRCEVAVHPVLLHGSACAMHPTGALPVLVLS